MVMGSNPGGDKEFFTREIKSPYDHLQVDFVNLISEMLFDPFYWLESCVCMADVPLGRIKKNFKVSYARKKL